MTRRRAVASLLLSTLAASLAACGSGAGPGQPAATGVDAARSSVRASAPTAVADGRAAVTVTVTARSAADAPVGGALVTFAATGGGNALSPASAAAGADGVAVAALTSTAAGPKALSATAGGVTLAGPTVTFLAGPASAATSTLVASRTEALADGVDGVVLTATLLDAHGNPREGELVTFAASGEGNVLDPVVATTSAAGVATSTLRTTRAGARLVSASAGALTLEAGVVTFLAGLPSAATSTLAASKATATADGVDAVLLTATLADAGGNRLAGVLVTFGAVGPSASLEPLTATTGPDGVATSLLRATLAGARLPTALAAGLTLAAAAEVSFVAGPPAAATSTLVASRASATADGVDEVTLTATLADAHGNPVAGATLAFGATGAGNTLAPGSAATGLDGVATTILRSTRAGAKAVSATGGGLTLTGPEVAFLPGPPSAATSSLAVSKAAAAADGADAVVLTATLADAQGNHIGGLAVTFAASGAGNVLDPVTATTSPAGEAVASLRSTRAGARLVSATAGALTLDAPVEVTFLAGPAAAAASTLAASRTSATADGADAVTLTATLADSNGNPVAGVAVDFAASGTGNALTPASAVTGADGVAVATLRSTRAEVKTVTATAGALVLAGPPVAFLAGAPDAAASRVAVSKTTATADGVDGITVTVTLADAQGNPVAGALVTFGATGGGTAFDPPTATTGADGVAVAVLRSTVAGAKDLSATADPATVAGLQVTFLAPAAAAGLSLTATPEVAQAGVQAVAVRATATDADGLPVANQAVTFSTGAAFAALSGATALTGADGVATVTLTAATAGSVLVTATAGSLTARLPRPVEFVGTGAALQVTEVGNAWFVNRPAWVEVFNNTAAAVDLSQYALRSTATNATTGAMAASVTFPLPPLVLAPGASAVLLGATGGARAGPRVALVGNATGQVPYWQGSGFVELQRLGQTVDFVRFGTSAATPASGPAWSGAIPAFLTGEAQLRRTLARAFDRRDGGSAADWAHVAFPTAGGPNDVPAGAADLDADGIPDPAEAPGATYAGLDLYGMGARPGVRDVFVELDRMATTDAGAIPQREALDRWLAMYPPHGVAVHVDAGSLLDGQPGRPYDLGQPDSLLAPVACVILDVPSAGCTTSLYDLKAQHLELARQNVFHYLLFALNDTASGTSLAFGRGEVGGNDILMTMAGFGLSDATPLQRNVLVNRQRLVLAHEFGHNLGLLHGGHEELGQKPNYLSVMNVLYGGRGLPDPAWADAGQRWEQARGLIPGDPCLIRDGLCADPAVVRGDYSDGSGAALDEAALAESLGLGRPGAAPIDWDRNLAIGLASVDLNGDGARTLLTDSDDWSRLVLPYAGTAGVSALRAGDAAIAAAAPERAPLMPLAGDVQPAME